MKITKYPQSCFMIESNGKSVLVDPGSLSFDKRFLKGWNRADFILITHKHSDHCNAEVIKNIAAPIYASAEVAKEYPNLKITIVKEGDKLQLADEISATAMPAFHGYIPWLKDKYEIHENIGWMVSMEGKKIYFTSDTICFKNEIKCDVLCAPISAHGLVMSPFEVALFAKECEATLVLPCHMDNPKYPVDIESAENMLTAHEINYRILNFGETIEI